jgi:RNA polymerase sigma-70 factor (ECF subfamily)
MSEPADRKSFEEIVENYYEDIYKLAFIMLKDRSEAEDVTQEAFLKAKRYLSSFNGTSSIKTWLYRITMNEVKNYIKSAERFRNAKPMYVPKASTDFSGIEEAMKQLDRQSYEVLYFKYFKDLSDKEIAFILNIPEGTVKSRLHAAKEKLKEVLSNE